ncbi:unnamed protein product [Paramecium sonneborni]|uniref:Uncharacterized protein n=1 Tax=Paramecium sonneborni TaxID=65129 RepID=A0A8S1R6J7_9CILI|nr:unnamed protein product [Paramecium sonneborni]
MNKLSLPTDTKDNEFFDEDAISKSTIQALNNSFDKEQLDEQIERPFTPIDTQIDSIPKEQCKFCKRQFFQGKLALHSRSCTADHPFLKKSNKQKTLIPLTQPVIQPCPYCQKKLRNPQIHALKCPARPKALDKYKVIASINEEEEADETLLQELSSSQPTFLPKIKQRPENLLSRSVPIVKCPSCQKTFEQKAADKHIQICFRMNSGNKFQRNVFCTNCGNKFANNHKYCGSCGKKRL